MFCENVAKRLGKCLFRASEEYFRDNLPDVSFPDGMEVTLQISRDPAHGDLTSNVAMRLASVIGKNPAVLGEGIIGAFRERIKKTHLAPFIESVNLKSGFINFRFSSLYYSRTLTYIYGKRNDFGRSDAGRKKRINLEFVSANPTGPLTIAHGRQAAIGDALARILSFSGFAVTREYYLNDIGRQMRLLGESVGTRYRNLFGKNDPMPEDGYMGEYVEDIAKEIKTKRGDSLVADSAKASGFFRNYALEYMMVLITKDLADFGVHFNVWTGQSSLEKHKEVEEVLGVLKKNGYIYEKDGAQWFESTKFGDDKDRVVVKSDASYTYLAPDIAYHADKYRRGYTRLIDILGPDHHGYIKRMKAAVKALGHPEGSLNMLIAQLVTLMRDGRTISMSTRKGEFISLRELIDELGKDVTRFFFLSRRLDSHLDFDITLAKKESADNPVFYIQYAHARICSIKKYSRRNRFHLFFRKTRPELMTMKEEKQLMRKLGEFPFAVASSASTLEPNRLVTYLNDLARCFHSFYTKCRVISEDTGLSKARLFLVECTRIVLANGLNLLNITLPERM